MKLRLVVATSVASLVLLSACGTVAQSPSGEEPGPSAGATASSGTGEQPVTGGRLVMGVEQNVESLDPTIQSTTATLNITAQIYENLVGFDLSDAEATSVSLEPELASNWTISDDGLVYTFTLHEGVEFHDGTPFSAEAVKANFDRALDPESPLFSETAQAALGPFLGNVASTRAIDDLTFEVTLSGANASFPTLLADRRVAIISPTALETYGEDIALHPTGTGPFRFVERTTSVITLEKNETYWGEAPYVDEIVWSSIPDAAARTAALIAGEVDVVMVLGPDTLSQARDAGNVTVEIAELPSIGFFMLNNRDGATANKEFRQALNWATDRDSIVKLVFAGDLAVPAPGPAPRTNRAYDPAADIYGYDLDKARDLIEQSGVETPVDLTFMYSTSGQSGSYAAGLAQVMQQDFADIGVNLSFKTAEDSAYLSDFRVGLDPDEAGGFTTWNTLVDDPIWIENMYHGALQPPNGNNRAWYDNPEVNDLLDQARQELDEDQRLAEYHEALGLIAEDAPWIWIVSPTVPRGFGERVHGLVVPPSTYVDLTMVWLSE